MKHWPKATVLDVDLHRTKFVRLFVRHVPRTFRPRTGITLSRRVCHIRSDQVLGYRMTVGLQDDPGHRNFYRNGIPTDVPLMNQDQDQDHTVHKQRTRKPTDSRSTDPERCPYWIESKPNPLFMTGGSLNVSQWAPGYLPSF